MTAWSSCYERVSRASSSQRGKFIEWLRYEGVRRYHHQHPYHHMMHDGQLTRYQLQRWVLNRYYYQTRIPIKRRVDSLQIGGPDLSPSLDLPHPRS